MHINEILNYFSNPKKLGENSYQVKCPAHRDDKASLTITEENNKILMHCHAGCDTENILTSVGLKEKDLFNNPKNEKPQIVAEYIYTDEKGEPLYKVVRFEPKNFMQAKYENGKYEWKMTNVRYVLYNLPNVIASETVFFVEGEKDADNLNKLGLVATTSVSGAASFNKRAKEYVEFLRDKVVYIIPDNDKAGYNYAEDIKNALKGISVETRVLKIIDIIKDFPEKGDISDVILKYGKEKTLELLEELVNNGNAEELEEEIVLDEDNIISIELFSKLYEYELTDIEKYLDIYGKIKAFCNKKRITGFDKNYKKFKDNKERSSKPVYVTDNVGIGFPKIDVLYKTNKYELNEDGFIYEIIPDVGKILVCYHPILPVEKYRNVEDGTEKIKIGYLIDSDWSYIIVDKSVISSSQSIIKLADYGIAVNSENAKHLIKYLAEIENLNKDIIKTSVSTSRLGWVGDVLMPYSDKYEFDNDKDMINIRERFEEKGKWEDWADFYREKRKYNVITRIVMASAVSSILLKRIKQNGFTLHIWGQSETGKTVVCMVGQSIFGNPSQTDGKGIGINFNLTNVGLEYKLNLYNNIPLFINEMQHQKDAKDYDKLLFMISEGKGKSRSTKNGGIAKENTWNNVAITNGEKSIIKDNSNAGAYNRCISCEITDYSFQNLSEAADYAKENYGTVIREILKHLDEYDCKQIFNEKLEMLKEQDTTNKQKILEATIMLGDKILTDIIFKDGYYLTIDDFEDKTIKRKDVAIEERALEVIKDWYISEKRHFLDEKDEETDNRVEVYGRKMKDGFVAFIPSILKNKLDENGFDYMEVANAWKRKDYLKSDKGKNVKNVRFSNNVVKCIVLNLKLNEEEREDLEVMPF